MAVRTSGLSESAIQRLMEEYEAISLGDDKELGFTASPRDGNLKIWDVVIQGLRGSDWEGALLRVELEFENDYPTRPPKAKFLTPNMWHPNISLSTGAICCRILDSLWNPRSNMRYVANGLQGLLANPNPNSCLNGDAGRQLRENKKEDYLAKVRAIAQASNPRLR